MNENDFSRSVSRREMLRRSGCGVGFLGLAGLLADDVRAESGYRNPMAPKSPHFPAKAKHVIHIFANGGPSQVDTFDPKPLLAKYAGKPLPMKYLTTERKTGARVAVAVQVFAATARAASRSATFFRNVARHGRRHCASSARCTPTCRTTSRRCC